MKKNVPQKTDVDQQSKGVRFSNEEDSLKSRHWRGSRCHSWIEIFFSAFTASYFAILLSNSFRNWPISTTIKFVAWSSVLSALPFYRVCKVLDTSKLQKKYLKLLSVRSEPLRAAISSLCLVVPLLFLQSYLGQQNVIVLYFALAILFRLIDSRSLYDNIALCILYTVHVQSVDTFYQKLWYTTMRLILWLSFFLGVFCGIILRRSTFRIWEHIRLLIILRKKSKQERVFSNFIAAAHFSPDLVTSKDKDKDVESPKRIDRSLSGLSQHNEPAQAGNVTVSTPYSNSLAKAASEARILFSFDQKPIISLEKVKLLDGFERKLATVIAFKQVISDDRECCLNDQSRHELHDLLDRISLQHNISCVRKFGDTWVGCIGLQKSWDNSRKDSYHAILMGCEVMLLAKRMQVQLCCAVESGKIDAGFVGCSSYDVFGPEIRWVLNMVEAKKYGHVLVGNSAKNLNTRRAAFDTDVFVNIHFGRVVIDTIWKTKQECEKVHSVYQFSELLRDEESLIQQYLGSDRTVKIVQSGSDEETIPISLSWQAMQKLLDGNETSKHYSKATNDRQRWDDEIACELFMSVEERFGMSLDDAVLKGLSENDLEFLHFEIETSVKSLMKSHFFGSYMRLLLLLSPKQYRVGVNDYISPLSHLEVVDDSQEFYCPLEPLVPYFKRLFGINVCENENGKVKEDNHSMRTKKIGDSSKYCISKEKKMETNLGSNVWRSESGSSWGHSSGSDRISVTLKPGINAGNKIKGQRNVPYTRKSGYSIHPIQHTDFEASVQCSEEKSGLDNSFGLSQHGLRLGLCHGIGGTMGVRSLSNRSGSDRGLTITRSVQNKKTDNLHASREALFSSTLMRNRHPIPTVYPTLIPASTSPSRNTSASGKPTAPVVGVSTKVTPPGVKKIEIDTKLLRELPERGLAKYTSDCRSINVSAIHAFTSFMALGTALLCIVDENFIYSRETIKPTYIFGFLALNLLVLNIAERKYDRIVCVVLFILRCLLAVCMMPYLINNKLISQNINDVKYLQGVAFFILCLWFPIALRQSFMFNSLELILHGFGFSYQWMLADGSNSTSFQLKMRTTMFPVLLMFLMLFWAIEYLCTVSYVIENILVPEALSLYQREYVHSRQMLQACSPSVPIEKSRELHCPRRYQSCAILAIHVKAADVLPGLVDVQSVASFLKEIMMLITSCVKECGLLKVTQFSGVFIAACPDVYDGDDITPINHIVQTIICLRKIQNKLDAFSKRNSVNVSIGAGLTSGPVTMGLLGHRRFCFDVSGAARDLAVSMATNQNDGIFATESFGPYIRDGQLYGDLVLREVTVTSGSKSMKWLQMDGAFNKGMQLDDFEYMCMLGRGGFGSVHLLWENATEKEYAIKAIPRKRGSAIPKMIQREFIILQQIQHANVVSFKCCIINKGMIYLVMSYVRGGNLKQIVERNKPDLKHLTLWFAELVLALNYVHSLGIIHRDVKPANCMIDASGHLKLADFGLSKIVSPTTSAVLDPTGTQGEVDNRNASATVAINLIKSILPLKSNMSEGEVSLPERSVQILLLDFNLMSSSATRLREMYFKVAAVSSAIEAHQTIASADFKAEIILIDLDSVNMLDPTSTMSSGLALLQELALSSKNIPIIGLSSIDDRDLRRRIIHAGAREVLSLPIHKSARETLSKYGRLYHHLNKADMPRNLSLVFPPGFLDADRTDEKARKDRERGDSGKNIVRKVPSPINTNDDNTGIGNSISKKEPEGEREGEINSKIKREIANSNILPSSLAGNTSSYSHVTYGTEHMNTPPNTINDPRQNPFRSAAKHVVSEGQQKHSAVGTIHFMAPEVIFEHKYGRSVDWWACGVTFYECTMRQHLFTGVDKETIIQHILSGTIDLEPLSQHSTLLKNLVEGLLVRNPNSRLGTDGAHTIMRQEFFKGIDWTTISVSNPSYKPAQHVNQRHSIKDKMLFYGEVEDNTPEVARRKEAGLGEYYRSREKEGNQGPSGGFMSRSKKRHAKNMVMRQRKEDFQKLTDKRKSWVSGNHLPLGAEGKKSSPYVSTNYMNMNKSSKGRNFLNRSGMMSASLDWSITMLPEGGSSHSDEDKGEMEAEDETEGEGGEGEGRDRVKKSEAEEDELDYISDSAALDNSENIGISVDSDGEEDLVEELEEDVDNVEVEVEELMSVIRMIEERGSLVGEIHKEPRIEETVKDTQDNVDERESRKADQLEDPKDPCWDVYQNTKETDILTIESKRMNGKEIEGSVNDDNGTDSTQMKDQHDS